MVELVLIYLLDWLRMSQRNIPMIQICSVNIYKNVFHKMEGENSFKKNRIFILDYS